MPVRGLLLKSVQAKRIYERGNNPADIDTEGGVIELGFGPREASVRGENGGITEDPRISDYLFADMAGDEFQSDHEFMEKAVRGSYYGRGSRLVAAVAGGGFKCGVKTWAESVGQAVTRVEVEAFGGGGGLGAVVTLANGAKIRCCRTGEADSAPASFSHTWDYGRETGYILPVGLAAGTREFPNSQDLMFE